MYTEKRSGQKRDALTLGALFGIPIRANLSWFVIVALITWSLAGSYLPAQAAGWSTSTYWLVGGLTAILFFGSVLLHELGHSLVARREGVLVRDITLFLFGGVAQLEDEPPTAGAEFRIAIAGPLTSLLLAGVFWLLALLAASSAVLAVPLTYLAVINLTLAFFNLLPGFPLDGGRVLRSIFWRLRGDLRTATRWASRIGSGVAIMMMLVGGVQMFLGGFFNGLWITFIGWYLFDAARASYAQVVMRELLTQVTVREAMSQVVAVVPAELPLDVLVAEHVLKAGKRSFVVTEGGEVQGMLTVPAIMAVPPHRRQVLTAGAIMTTLSELPQVTPDVDGWTLLRRMTEAHASEASVLQDGRPLGVVTLGDLLSYARLRTALA